MRLNATSFSKMFGIGSAIYNESYSSLNKHFKNKFAKLKTLFEEWHLRFSEIYKKADLDEELFIKHSYFMLLIKMILYINKYPLKNYSDIKSSIELSDVLDKENNTIYIDALFNWTLKVPELGKKILSSLKGCEIEPGDLFYIIYQELVSPSTRLALGEFYTHPELAQLMAEKVYNFGMKVLDPSCGSGTFLIEIAKIIQNTDEDVSAKINAIRKIFGFDVNPIAVLVSKANLLLFFKQFQSEYPELDDSNSITINIILCDSLFPSEQERANINHIKEELVELIIGNPPWLVINSLYSRDYQKKVKDLGKHFNIFLGGSTTTSTEITTLFIYQCKELFLQEGGTIFFVTPASLMTGSQHEKFRWFLGFKDIEFWDFDIDLYNIHNLCFMAKKGSQNDAERMITMVSSYHIDMNPLKLKYINQEEYKPEYVNLTDKGYLVGKLNPIKRDDKINYIPIKTSEYEKHFYQGASLVPRNLLLVRIQEGIENQKVIIYPDPNLKSKVDATWNFKAYNTATVDKEDIHPAIKSSELNPFCLIHSFQIFLPLRIMINKNGQEYYEFKDLDEMELASREHYEFLEKLYRNHRKEGAKVKSLRERTTFQGYLSKTEQRAPLRVVYNGIGVVTKAAIIRDPEIIIDTSLYHAYCNSEEEAYYLLGVINSKILRENIGRVCSTGAGGSIRNIHLNIWKFPFPIFKSHSIQLKIAEHAKVCEDFVQNHIDSWVSELYNKTNGKCYCNHCKNIYLERNIRKHLANCKKRKTHGSLKENEWKFIRTMQDIKLQPKKIQNQLLKNENYKNLLNELDILIIELLKLK